MFRSFVKQVYYNCLEIGDSLIRNLIYPKKQSAHKKVLIARLDKIGDFILWLDSAKELRKFYPPDSCSITLLGNQEWVELAEKLPYWDEIWTLNRLRFIKDPVYRWRLLARIRKSGFHFVIHPTFSREYHYGDAIVHISGAEERIGSMGDRTLLTVEQKKRSDHWYNRLIPASKSPLMELKRNVEFLHGLGMDSFQSGITVLPVDGNLPHWFEIKKPYFVISPGASVALKQWFVKNFARLAMRIHEKTGWDGVCCGSKEENALGQGLAKQTDGIVKNYIGCSTLSELIEVIAQAKLFIGNDSAAVHMAAAVSTPAVCILGGGHFGRFMPYHTERVRNKQILPTAVYHRMDCYHCNWYCVHPIAPWEPAPCIAKITLDEVWHAVEKLIPS